MSGEIPRPRALRRVELLRDLDRRTGRVLMVDGVEQSYVDDYDAEHLEFEYMQHMALVVDVVLPRPHALTCVHLGGGAMTMARWLNATRPGSSHRVVEFSPEVVDVARTVGLPDGTEVVVADAAVALPTLAGVDADLVIWDLYDGPLAVTGLLTLEAVAAMRRLLASRGWLLLNVSDKAPFDVVRPVLASLRECFDGVVLLAEPPTLRGRRSGNCVLAAGQGVAVAVAELARAAAGAPVRATVVADTDLDAFVADTRPATADAPLPLPDAGKGRAFL